MNRNGAHRSLQYILARPRLGMVLVVVLSATLVFKIMFLMSFLASIIIEWEIGRPALSGTN